MLDECVSAMAWRGFSSALEFGSHCLPWGSSDLKECSEFTYDGAFLSAVSSASWTPLPKTLSYESWLVLC